MTGLPHFFIVGAMKSGTTTLHRLLDGCDDVFLPREETFFFDLDDKVQHPDFRSGGTGPDWGSDGGVFLAPYRALLAAAPPGALLGDDSTSYLASTNAAARIRRLCPDARIVAILRNPTERTLSHYWHLVRTGRATRTLEATLYLAGFRHGRWEDSPANRARPHATLLQRSLYMEQLSLWKEHFPAEQLHVEIFEEFVADPVAGLRRVRSFLGLPEECGPAPRRTRFGASRWPRSVPLRLLQNRIFEPVRSPRYEGHLGLQLGGSASSRWSIMRRLDRLLAWINESGSTHAPAAPDRVRADLDGFFGQYTRALEGVLNRQLETFGWPSEAAERHTTSL